jgi:hypothetical protein
MANGIVVTEDGCIVLDGACVVVRDCAPLPLFLRARQCDGSAYTDLYMLADDAPGGAFKTDDSDYLGQCLYFDFDDTPQTDHPGM